MGVIVMSEKERVRLEVLGWKERVGVSLVKAAEAMGVSYRQARRIWKRYKANRSEVLVHLGLIAEHIVDVKNGKIKIVENAHERALAMGDGYPNFPRKWTLVTGQVICSYGEVISEVLMKATQIDPAFDPHVEDMVIITTGSPKVYFVSAKVRFIIVVPVDYHDYCGSPLCQYS